MVITMPTVALVSAAMVAFNWLTKSWIFHPGRTEQFKIQAELAEDLCNKHNDCEAEKILALHGIAKIQKEEIKNALKKRRQQKGVL